MKNNHCKSSQDRTRKAFIIGYLHHHFLPFAETYCKEQGKKRIKIKDSYSLKQRHMLFQSALMVNIDCRCDRIWNYLGDKILGTTALTSTPFSIKTLPLLKLLAEVSLSSLQLLLLRCLNTTTHTHTYLCMYLVSQRGCFCSKLHHVINRLLELLLLGIGKSLKLQAEEIL